MSQESNHILQFQDWKKLGNWNSDSVYDKVLYAKNPMCGDESELFVSEEQPFCLYIVGLKGESCSICEASAGILYAKKRNWTKESVLSEYEIKAKYLESGNGLEAISEEERKFWEIVFHYPSRHRCALLPYVALKKGF